MQLDTENTRPNTIRLKGYDYSENGAYFVTVCAKAKAPYFEMYPELNNIVQAEWKSIPERFPTVIADAFVVMPNHIHAVIILKKHDNVGATFTVARARASLAPTQSAANLSKISESAVDPHKDNDNVEAIFTVARARASLAPTIGNIVGAYKSLCVNRWLEHIKKNNLNTVGKIWQRNYYEHVIRNEEELNLVREYIIYNPLKWQFDSNNPNHVFDLDYLKKWQWLEG